MNKIGIRIFTIIITFIVLGVILYSLQEHFQKINASNHRIASQLCDYALQTMINKLGLLLKADPHALEPVPRTPSLGGWYRGEPRYTEIDSTHLLVTLTGEGEYKNQIVTQQNTIRLQKKGNLESYFWEVEQ